MKPPGGSTGMPARCRAAFSSQVSGHCPSYTTIAAAHPTAAACGHAAYGRRQASNPPRAT
ncbi:MAG TPA: hypothetical protein VFY17_02915 [Pilimelia sp.]|nr:hypothetical protein [Pilimelia sp.]